MIFGVWNHEKIWYRYSLYICPHYLYTAANSPWEIQKKSFFNSIIHTYFRLFTLSQKKHCNCCAAAYLFTYCYLLLLIICVALCRVPMVRESRGILRSQRKQRGSGKSQGILKYRSLDQLFMHIFTIFVGFWALRPQTSTGAGSAPVNTAV